jgi:choline kinase
VTGSPLIGMVLAAGAGRRLEPLTRDLPKTLLEVAPQTTILDVALSNLSACGITDVVVVTGFAAHQIEDRRELLQKRHGVTITTVFNDKALEWNNAYSLWLARDYFARGVLLCNGDTVHPRSVERVLLDHRGRGLVLAIDDVKVLADEEMKVTLTPDGTLARIHKGLDPSSAAGEYIGVTLIEPEVAGHLADSLRATWERDTGLYYEDGYQEFVERGLVAHVARIGAVDWVEVDNHADLARAREIACHY